METDPRLAEVRKALNTPAEAVFIYTLHDGSFGLRFHYLDACIALKRTVRGDAFNEAGLASSLRRAALVPDFKLANAVQVAGVLGIKRRLFGKDAYAVRGGLFHGKTRAQILDLIVMIIQDCSLGNAGPALPERVAAAVAAGQLAVAAAGYSLCSAFLSIHQGCDLWYTDDGIHRAVVL